MLPTHPPPSLFSSDALDSPPSVRSSTATYVVLEIESPRRKQTPITCFPHHWTARIAQLLQQNAVQRTLSASVLAPAVIVFLLLSPNVATTIVCSLLLSACAYEYSWIVHRIQFRFLTLTEPSSQGTVPGGSLERFNEFFLTKPELLASDDDHEIRDAMNLDDCAISAVARRFFNGSRCQAALAFSIPASLVSTCLFQVGVALLTESFHTTELYTYRWLYSLVTDLACALAACHTPNWRYAFVLFVEKTVFSVLTVYSSMCPINQLSCGSAITSTDLTTTGMLVLVVFHVALRRQAATTFVVLLLDLLGYVYLIGTMSVLISFLDDHQRVLYRKLLITLLGVVWASDSGAYVAGKLFEAIGFRRGHVIAPHVSPNKDYEGTLAAVGCGVATIFIIAALADVPGTAYQQAIIASLAVVVGRVGDLFESLLKRAAGIKHSGCLIPGHGGVLDRVDALLFATMVFGRYYAILLN